MTLAEEKATPQRLATILIVAAVFSYVLIGSGNIVGLKANSAFAQAPESSGKTEKSTPKDSAAPKESPIPKESQKSISLQKRHPWATFTPGVWKTVRIVSESFDKDGKSLETSLTDVKSTLESLTDKGVELRVEVCLWLDGRRLDPQPQSVEQGYHGEVGLFETETIKELKSVELTIEGKAVPCKVLEVTLTEPEVKRARVVKIFYNDKVSPYLLRRESEIRDTEKKTVLSQTTMAVNSLDMPWESCGRLFSVAVARTAKVTPKDSMTSITFLSPEVPGQVVYEATKEIDSEGKMIRRSVSRMTDFSTSPATEPRPGILKRLRAARAQKNTASQE